MFFEMMLACFVAMWLIVSLVILSLLVYHHIDSRELRYDFGERPFYNFFMATISVLGGPITVGILFASQ